MFIVGVVVVVVVIVAMFTDTLTIHITLKTQEITVQRNLVQ